MILGKGQRSETAETFVPELFLLLVRCLASNRPLYLSGL